MGQSEALGCTDPILANGVLRQLAYPCPLPLSWSLHLPPALKLLLLVCWRHGKTSGRERRGPKKLPSPLKCLLVGLVLSLCFPSQPSTSTSSTAPCCLLFTRNTHACAPQSAQFSSRLFSWNREQAVFHILRHTSTSASSASQLLKDHHDKMATVPPTTIYPNSHVGFDSITSQIERKLLKRGFQFNVICVGTLDTSPPAARSIGLAPLGSQLELITDLGSAI